MTHTTMLNLGTFALAIPGAIASVTDQVQKARKRLATRKGRLQKVPFSESHPIWSGTLTLSMLFALAGGFWMVFHPPTTRQTVVTIPTPQSVPSSTNSVPVTPLPRSPKPLGGHPAHQKSPISTPAANPTSRPIVITGGAKQGGDGGCQQNIIGGNGNTQNCVVPPFSVSNEQGATIAAYLKAANLGDQREVLVEYEYSAVGGAEAAQNLVAAFNEGGINATLGKGAVMYTACNYQFIAPGLSVDCVKPSDRPFLEALAEAFAVTNLASTQNPIQARGARPDSTAPLIFVIRKR